MTGSDDVHSLNVATDRALQAVVARAGALRVSAGHHRVDAGARNRVIGVQVGEDLCVRIKLRRLDVLLPALLNANLSKVGKKLG